MMIQVAAAACAAMAAAGAMADGRVEILSRVSRMGASYSDGSPRSWSKSAQFTGLGTSDIVLPHGGRHAFTVTETFIGGSLRGSSASTSFDSRGEDQSLDTMFRVVGGSVTVRIEISGGVFPSGAGEASPLLNNAYFWLTRGAASVFELHADMPSAITPPFGETTWDDAVWTGVLEPRNYRLRGGGNGSQRYGSGSGNWSGSGGIDVTMTMTPTPGTMAVLGMAVLAGRRRR